MKSRDIIPFRKELNFIVKLVLTITVCSGFGIFILYLLMNNQLDDNFRNSFMVINQIYKRMDFYILIAITTQVVVSSIIIFYISLYFSHKIAGPMFRLKMLINQYIEGKEIQSVSFRETDFLDAVSENFTHFLHYHSSRKKQYMEIHEMLLKLKEMKGDNQADTIKHIHALVKNIEAQQ